MSNSVLRIRFLSVNDAADQPFSDILLYLKRLVQVSTSTGKLEICVILKIGFLMIE